MSNGNLTNILPFDAGLLNAMGDYEYRTCHERANGVLGQTADSGLQNKLFAQCSGTAYAVAKFIADRGYEAFDYDTDGMLANFKKALLSVLKDRIDGIVFNTRKSSTAYSEGSTVQDFNIPLWGELECIKSGVTSNGDLTGVSVSSIGHKIQDGSVVWAVRSKRFRPALNTPVPFVGNFKAVKAPNGIIFWHPVHPDIGLPMTDCRFCDGQDLTAYGLGKTADMRGRMLKGCSGLPSDSGSMGGEYLSSGGSDSVTLSNGNMPTDSFGVTLPFKSSQSGEHSHSYQYPTVSRPAVPYITNTYSMVSNASAANTSAAGAHSHTVTGSQNIQLNTYQTPVNITPRHYALAYIQRIY